MSIIQAFDQQAAINAAMKLPWVKPTPWRPIAEFDLRESDEMWLKVLTDKGIASSARFCEERQMFYSRNGVMILGVTHWRE